MLQFFIKLFIIVFNIQKSNIVIVYYKLSFKKNYNNIVINFQKLTLISSFTKCLLLNINVYFY